VRAAGVRQFGDQVEGLELPEPRALRPDEVLIDVRAAGVGNWDEFVRTGSWDLGIRPPMALGVEAAGLVTAVGDRVTGIRPGDRVTTHAVPLREQGAWAERFIAAAEHIAAVPADMAFDVAAALPVPALTADQAVGAALAIRAGQTVLVNGAGGVTGGMLVQLAAHRGATVIATAGADSAGRVAAMGASTVLDYHQADWPEQVRALTAGGVDAAANAARSGSGAAVRGGPRRRQAGHDHGRPARGRAGHCHVVGAGRPGRQTAGRSGRAARPGRTHDPRDRAVCARARWRRADPGQARSARLGRRAAARSRA
jgi:NADPH:quinone reductase-like Zn-dependent oxidoreductase